VTIPKDIRIILNALIVFRIAVDIVPLVYIGFAVKTVVIPRSTYYKSKSKRGTISNTGIVIDFQRR